MTTSEMQRGENVRWDRSHISPSKLSVWMKCPASYWYQYVQRVPRQSKVFFPQGTTVHLGVELLHNALAAGETPDAAVIQMKMEQCWLDEVEKAQSGVFDNKGNRLSPFQLETAYAECERWYSVYERNILEHTIPDFNPLDVKETEVDAMREVIHRDHGPLGVAVRGRIDWVMDLSGETARLGDLKTASTHWMGQWAEAKAHGQLQATAYGYITGKPLDFSYVIIPKVKAHEAHDAKVEHYKTTRNGHHYLRFEDIIYNFLRQTDVLNNHAGFVPYAANDPSKYTHCSKLCDFKEQCGKDFFGL